MPVSQICQGCYQLALPVVNVFLLESTQGLILIDAGPAQSSSKLLALVRQAGYNPDDIHYIFITHAHYDHSGGLMSLLNNTSAQAFMHPYCAALLKRGIAWQPRSQLLSKITDFLSTSMPFTLPFISVKQVPSCNRLTDRQYLPDGQGLQVIYAPGHTREQVVLYHAQHGGILFAADSAENKRQLKLPGQNQDRKTAVCTARKLAAMVFEKAAFGHGQPIMNKASLLFSEKFG